MIFLFFNEERKISLSHLRRQLKTALADLRTCDKTLNGFSHLTEKGSVVFSATSFSKGAFKNSVTSTEFLLRIQYVGHSFPPLCARIIQKIKL